MSKTLSGVPDWCSTERYDIVAKVAEADVPVWKNLTFKQKSLAMQPMLEDRFHLKWHKTRMESGYELVIAKNGSRLKEAVLGDTYPNGLRAGDGTRSMELSCLEQDSLARRQAWVKFCITSSCSPVPRWLIRQDSPERTTSSSSQILRRLLTAGKPPVSNGPSLFSAVQKQLGLKLVRERSQSSMW